MLLVFWLQLVFQPIQQLMTVVGNDEPGAAQR
jgi:hypothetical protein